MHQSFESLGGCPWAFTLYATESKWILAKVNGMNSFAPICPTRTILPFLKKDRRTKNHVLQSSGVFWNDSINTSVCLAIFTTKLNRKLLKKSGENRGEDKTRLMNLLYFNTTSQQAFILKYKWQRKRILFAVGQISTEISVDIAVDTRSIVGQHSVDSRSIVGRHSVETRPIVVPHVSRPI